MLTNLFAVIAVAALVAGAVLQLVLALAGYRARRMGGRHIATLRDLQKDMLGLQQEVTQLRRQLAVAGKPAPAAPVITASPMRPVEPANPAYALAGKLARKGASGEDLMETCGLSRGEVDLITRLSRLGQSARPQGVRASA